MADTWEEDVSGETVGETWEDRVNAEAADRPEAAVEEAPVEEAEEGSDGE